MEIQVRELTGLKSLRPLNAFSALIIGVKMLPAYGHLTYEEFLAIVDAMDDEGQKAVFRNAASIVQLDPDDVAMMLYFCNDKNGIPFDSTNMKNLNPKEIVEMIVAVCLKIVKIKVDFVSEDEKKN